MRRRSRYNDARQTFSLAVPVRPRCLGIDPRYDLFRRLDVTEIPPTLGQLFGAEQVRFVLPAKPPEPMRSAYADLATRLAQGAAQTVWDDTLDHLPQDRPTWVLGWENRFAPIVLKTLPESTLRPSPDTIIIEDRTLTREADAVVLAGRRSLQTLAFVGMPSPAAAKPLARKLPQLWRPELSGLFPRGHSKHPQGTVAGRQFCLDRDLRCRLHP